MYVHISIIGTPNSRNWDHSYSVVAVWSSGILKAKQKLAVTFNFDKQDVIDFTKIFKNDNVQGLRSKFMFFGLLFYQ